MKRLRRAVVPVLAVLAVMLSSSAAQAAVPAKVPAGCTVQPGRYGLAYDTKNALGVLISAPGITCVSTVHYTIVVNYKLNRWYGSSVGWKLERTYKATGTNVAYALDDGEFDCSRSGALMSLTAVVHYYKKDVGLVAQITYAGRTTALCSSAPKAGMMAA